MRAIVPIHEMRQRMPEQGRIRLGTKGPKGEPRKLNRFRFTSADRDAIALIAEKYGGEVTPWTQGPHKDHFQVTVTAARIPIVLPSDPLDGTPIYEAWSGGGCLRRCDGVECTLAKARDAKPDVEPAVVECPCRAEKMMICKPTTRLNVVLSEIPFGGSWRLESHGWNAAQELPGMVAMVQVAQASGLTAGYLEIHERSADQGGKKFIVPAVGVPESIEALAAGQMKLAALGHVREIRENLATRALDAPKPAQIPDGEWYDDDEPVDKDDDVADAEIVNEPGSATRAAQAPEHTGPEAPARRRTTLSPRLRALHAGLNQVMDIDGIDIDVDTFRHALALLVSKGRTSSSKELDDDALRVALDLCADLLGGERRYLGVAEDGHLRVTRRVETA